MNLSDKTLAEVIELFGLFISNDYQTILKVAVDQGIHLAGCQRCCLILFNKEDELVIKAGLPKVAHGIRMKVSNSEGGTFLRSVIEKREEVFITNPITDKRLGYMSGLIEKCGITSILFVPFYYKNDNLGIMIFDGQGSYEFTDCVRNRIRLLVGLVATSLGVLYETYTTEEKIIRKEKLAGLGKNYAGISHIIRNANTSIGGIARRISKRASEGGLDKESLLRYAKVIIFESDRIETSLNNVLEFVSFSPEKLKKEKVNINKLLSNQIWLFSESHPDSGIVFNFSPGRLLENIRVEIDATKVTQCVSDLLRNALEANATRIWISSKLKFGKKVLVTFCNDGKKIPAHMMDDIFHPFVSGKKNGSGLGLANVKAIIQSHGGDITLNQKNKTQTEFMIELPLN